MDEIDALKFLKSFFEYENPDLILGIGDDSAVIKLSPDKLLVTSTDSMVQGQHFLIDKMRPYELGRKAVAVSISDIAAMGAIPKFILSSIGLSRNISESYFKEMIFGIKDACNEYGIELVGGNLTGAQILYLDITTIGEIKQENVIKRSGAKIKDDIYVSGTLGDSSLGLQFIKSDNESKYLLERHKNPQPRLILGQLLSEKGLASSMIDVSDGLFLDLSRITIDFSLGADIQLQSLPLSKEYKLNYQLVTNDLYEFAVTGGEDYELLFTTDQNNSDLIRKLSIDIGLPITKIGTVNQSGLIKFIDENNFIRNFESQGFVHLN